MGKYDYAPTYSYMKAKTQNMIREDFYFSSLLLADEMMFTYDNLPESISPKFLEDYLNISGSAGITRDGSGSYLVCPYPSRAAMPDLDQYGDGMHLEGCTMNGKTLSGTIGEDAVIIYNIVDNLGIKLISVDAFKAFFYVSGNAYNLMKAFIPLYAFFLEFIYIRHFFC